MSKSNPKTHRRSERVLLQVAVIVKTELDDGKRVQFQAFTQRVNAHGGLLESPVRMTISQRITLVNPRSEKEVACRVVQAEGPSGESFAIAFEFDQPNPEFWPITFPPANWGVA